MEKHSLKAKKRTLSGRKVKQLRKQGFLPANVYGKNVKSAAIEVLLKDFEAVFAKAGETGLIELSVDNDLRPVLIHNVQYHAVRSNPLHVDFLQVNLKEKVTTKVPVELIGDSPAVLNKVGVLLTLISELEVEALPGDLPDKIEISVVTLSDIDQTVKVSDLKISDKVKILTLPDTTVVQVAPLVSKEAEKQAQEDEAAKVQAAAEAAPADATGAPQAASSAEPTPSQEQKKEESKK